MRKLLLPLLFLSFGSFACELTPEYKKLRTEVKKEITEPYNSCLKAARAHFFYKAVAKCKEEGRGEDIAGGCYHVVSYEVTHDKSELKHCEILNPKIAEIIEYLNEVAEEEGIQKCLK
ncbi:hypothetical protein KCM76_24955 [Zooshikella marina]|uniref:hypothetical protein n=1 Tax=Zooshikella ganghwensis TaxID=202772 RepID=UPI001BAED043|nr:hypothetical protein [Zooshikella ganghwensis]MBU2709269.1 hypothetical protein [Zooshikella ganghwensis]